MDPSTLKTKLVKGEDALYEFIDLLNPQLHELVDIKMTSSTLYNNSGDIKEKHFFLVIYKKRPGAPI